MAANSFLFICPPPHHVVGRVEILGGSGRPPARIELLPCQEFLFPSPDGLTLGVHPSSLLEVLKELNRVYVAPPLSDISSHFVKGRRHKLFSRPRTKFLFLFFTLF